MLGFHSPIQNFVKVVPVAAELVQVRPIDVSGSCHVVARIFFKGSRWLNVRSIHEIQPVTGRELLAWRDWRFKRHGAIAREDAAPEEMLRSCVDCKLEIAIQKTLIN